MHRRLHVFTVALVVLLTIIGWASASMRPFAAPARAQVVTPDPSPPSFANQQFVIVSDNTTNPGEGNPATFATGELPDSAAYPVTTVRVHNHTGDVGEQRFWLSVRIRQQDTGVDVVPEEGYAQMGLIAPGGDAIYTVTFPDTPSARVEFEVDGSTDEAVMLTMLQFALEAGFTAADLTGLGGHDAEIGRDLAEVVAEQYLADLPTLVPCVNAVASVQRGLDDQEQFERDLQGCLESPIWQASVDQVLTRAAKRDWFQQSLNLAGKAIPQVGATLKTVKAGQFATQLWTMYETFHPEVPGAMVGTVAFLSVDTTAQETLGAATAVPNLTVFEVVGRAQVAIAEAGTYHFEQFDIDDTGSTLSYVGEVDIKLGVRTQSPDGSGITYHTGREIYSLQPDGSWLFSTPMHGYEEEPLVSFLGMPATSWTLVGTEPVDDRPAYIIERDYVYQMEWTEKLWIEAETFLPVKRIDKGAKADDSTEPVRIYSGFGEPVDVEVPQEALQASQETPTPEPTPVPVGTEPELFDPAALYYHLWWTWFPDSELPPGFISARVAPMPESTTQELSEYGIFGWVGAVEVEIPTSGGINRINYLVYPTVGEAELAYANAQDGLTRRNLRAWGTCELDRPSAVHRGRIQRFGFSGDYALCLAPVGNVLVIGSSALPGEALDQTVTNAIDLAGSGIEHLAMLLSDNPPPTVPELPDAPAAVIVNVRADEDWQDSGVQVDRGDTVIIRYISGVWSTADSYYEYFLRADGDPYSTTVGKIPSFAYGALIGRIGCCEPFGVGLDLTLEASSSGSLFLRTNDPGTEDNWGSLTVAIAVGRADSVETAMPGVSGAPVATPMVGTPVPDVLATAEAELEALESADATGATCYREAYPNNSIMTLTHEAELREKASMDSSAVTVLPAGTVLEVVSGFSPLGAVCDWWPVVVTSTGQSGFIIEPFAWVSAP
jgi:hypothetical protein